MGKAMKDPRQLALSASESVSRKRAVGELPAFASMLRRLPSSLFVALVLVLPSVPRAETSPAPEPRVLVLQVEEKAPFTGLLVPEERFKEMLAAQQPQECVEPLLGNKTFFWVGFVLGSLTVAATLYGGVQLVKAAK